MKLNLDNFLRACDAEIDKVHYIIDDDRMVRTERASLYSLPCRYHTVKWWSLFNRNGKVEMLLYLENPHKKYDWSEWVKRREYFLEVSRGLEKGD